MAGKRKRLVQYGKQTRRKDLSSMFFPNTNELDQDQKPPPLPANKPTSQKAATMPAAPNEDDVKTLIEVVGMGRTDAVRYLKVGLRELKGGVVYMC